MLWNLLFPNFVDRSLAVLVMPAYEPLWKVREIHQFEVVFDSCFDCYFSAYTSAGILYRDISDNNLMVRKTSTVFGFAGILGHG
ncbi:hypothetical protein H0H87_012323 [Tephrocybe sp. NHM501043]|nr:hypothetical protein H0H87_012323 [Tephrocybe sp. NHM501043]